MNWHPIASAPKDRAIIIGAWVAGRWRQGFAVQYFGDWGSTEPILGDPFIWSPTHWREEPLPPANDEAE